MAKSAMALAPVPADETVTIATSLQGPAEEAIAELAYSYWEARGYQGGSPEEDWLQAENELMRLGELGA
jgi:hypothetical protein